MKEYEKNEALILNDQTFPIIEQITSGMPGGFFIYHADGDEQLIYVNQALIRIYGCEDLEDFKRHTGYTFKGMVHPDDWERISTSINDQIAESDEDLDYVEYRIRRKDGGIRWLEDWGHFVHTETYGDVYYVFVGDATERHLHELRNAYLAQERLKAMEKLEHETIALRLVHEILFSGMWSMEFNQQGQMTSVFWSNEFRAMLGYHDEEDFPDVLESWSDLIHPEDKERVLQEYYSTIEDYTGKKVYNVEYRVLTKSQGYRWFRAAGKLSRRPDGSPITYVGMFVDVTDRKQAREELARQRKLLEDALEQARQASRAKTAFLSNMSHDIRTPMNAIIGFTTLASEHVEDTALVRDYLSRITASSNHLLGLINDVLDMSRIESGSTTLNLNEMDLAEIIDEINAIIRPQAKEKDQTFDIFVSPLTHERLQGDKLRINQVLINLLSNSVKYTQAGGVIQMRVEELPQVMKKHSRIRFTVSDNGMGMSEDYLKVIFDPFTREETEATYQIQGTGLGMAITKSLVDLMDGSIKVTSKLGEGSTFTVELELRILEQEDDAQFWKDCGVKRIIVADDEESVCQNIIRTMSQTGVEVEYATSGEAAFDKLCAARQAGRPYDVILLDWKMPHLNGLDTARLIRERYPEKIPIVLLTAYDWSEVEHEALKIGIHHFMPKPFFMSTFKNAVSHIKGDTGKKEKDENDDVVRGKHILVVDDIEVNRIILVKILSTLGATCTTACNGQEAVETFGKSEPGEFDMILMDVQMPMMDGYAATRAIRAGEHPTAKTIPIIAMTANAFVDDVRDAIESGMDAHIAKPVQIDNLKSTIQEVLNSRSEQAENT